LSSRTIDDRLARLSPQRRKLLEKRLREQREKAAPLIPRVEGGTLPSFPQLRLWVSEQMEAFPSIYNNPFAWQISGLLDRDLTERVLDEILKRHCVLRTRLTGSEPLAIVVPVQYANPVFIDLAGLPEGERKQTMDNSIKAACKAPFRVHQEPLIRFFLYRWSEDRHILLTAAHHLIMDGWSKTVFQSDFCRLYDFFNNAVASALPVPVPPAPALPELAIRYSDFAMWQHKQWESGAWANHAAFWRELLKDAPYTEIPGDFPRPLQHRVEGKRLAFKVSPQLTQALNRLGRRHGATLFITLLTAFNILLHRYTGGTDLVVGTHIAGRRFLELEPLLGCFYNNLVIRADLAGNPSAAQLTARMREVALTAFDHQDFPFEKMVERVQREPGRTPLFGVIFHLRRFPDPGPPPLGLAIEPLPLEVTVSRFDFTLEMEERRGQLTGALDYNIHLYKESRMVRMVGHLTTLLEAMTADPTLPVGFLEIVTAAEKKQLLDVWNGRRLDFPRENSIHWLFEAQAALRPGATAAVLGDRFITYDALNAAAQRVQYHLRRLGAKRGDIIGLKRDRNLEMLAALLGICNCCRWGLAARLLLPARAWRRGT